MREFVKINNKLKPQDRAIKKEESVQKLTKQELNFLRSNIEKRLLDLKDNFTKLTEDREVLQAKIIDMLKKSITAENSEDNLQKILNKLSIRLLETYQSTDSSEDKNIEISRIINFSRSIITNEIRAKKMSLPNQIQLDKSGDRDDQKDKILLQIAEIEKFIDEVTLLVKAEQSYVVDELGMLLNSISEDSLDQEKDLKKLARQVNYLEQILKLDTAKPKTQISTKSIQLVNQETQLLFVEGHKYHAKDLIKVLSNDLLKYDLKQLNIFRDYLLRLKDEGDLLDEFFMAIINILKYSDNFIEGARRIAIIIRDIIPDNTRQELVENLWQYSNYVNIVGNDINKIAEFFVGINFIQDQEQELNLSDEQIKHLVADIKKDLEDKKTDIQPQESFVDRALESQEDKVIKRFLLGLIKEQKFTTILYCTPHGRAKSVPHIDGKTPRDLFKENLVTSKQDLEEILGCNIDPDKTTFPYSEDLLARITEVIIDNLTDNFKKRGSGSHNACFKIPKIFPHKGSVLSDQERKFYIERFKKLEACVIVAI